MNIAGSSVAIVAGRSDRNWTSVTVNGLAAAVYADDTFARAGFSLVDGVNTFTAIAQDAEGRSATNQVSVKLPASLDLSYDLNGNLITNGTRILEYDDENQLIRINEPGKWKSEFVYDGKLRRRIRREYEWRDGSWAQTAEVRYIYDGMLVIQERNQLNVPTATYTRGLDLSGTLQGAGGIGGLLARSHYGPRTTDYGLSHTYYHADGNGNVTALVDDDQNVAARYLYDPYGNLLGMTGPQAAANPYRFSSKEQHERSGLYYYGYRFYDPTLQRWINRDPIEEKGAVNLYAFAANTPTDNVDFVGFEDQSYRDSSCCNNGPKKLATKFLGSLGKKLKSMADKGGDSRTAKAIGVLNKALFLIGASKRACNARNPEGCDDFLKTGDFIDCMLCCQSIHDLFNQEVSGIAFLGTCRYACRNAK